jgi:hypothetical protein
MSRCDIAGGARLLMAPGGVHEVRVLEAGKYGTISGFFDDCEKLAEAVASLMGATQESTSR